MRTLSLSIAIGAAAIAALVRLTVFAQPRPDVKIDAKNVELVSHFDLGWYMPATPPGIPWERRRSITPSWTNAA